MVAMRSWQAGSLLTRRTKQLPSVRRDSTADQHQHALLWRQDHHQKGQATTRRDQRQSHHSPRQTIHYCPIHHPLTANELPLLQEHVRREKEIINVRPQNLTFSPFGLSTNRERRATERPALSLREIVEETDSEEVEYNGMNDNVWKSGEQMGKGHDGA